MSLMNFPRWWGRNRDDDGRLAFCQIDGRTRPTAGRPTKLRDDFSRETLPSDYVKTLYDYWSEMRGLGPMPPVSAIDPTLLPRGCLPYLCILEVEHEDLRLRARLTGTTLVERLGLDLTGLYLDELSGIAAQIKRLLWCVTHARPYLAESSVSFAPNDFMNYQILTLPFGEPGGPVERLVCAFYFLRSDENHGT